MPAKRKKPLDTIPEATQKEVIEYAETGKNMLFIGGNEEQKLNLADLAHKSGCYPDYGELLCIDCLYQSPQDIQIDIAKILKSSRIGTLKLETKEIQKKNEGVQTSVDKNKMRYTTLFFDNLLTFDTKTLQKLTRMVKYQVRGEATITSLPEIYSSESSLSIHPLVDHVKITNKKVSKDPKTGKELADANDVTFESTYKLLIIVHSPEPNKFPEWFIKPFEKVCLETKIIFDDKTLVVIINGRKYDSLQDGEYKLFKLLYSKLNNIVAYDEIQTKDMLGTQCSKAQIQNIISDIKETFNDWVDIKNKRGVGYWMTVK